PNQLWEARLAPNSNFTRYMRREVLGKHPTPLVWGLDQADRLAPCSFGTEFFSLLRAWYNQRVIEYDGAWSRLTMIITYSTEAHLLVSDANQSPFNVGTRLVLEDFSIEQVEDLNRRHGAPLRNRGEVERFY